MMNKRCIGIDIDSFHLRAVQVVSAAGRFQVERVFSRQMRRTTDSSEETLKTLTAEHGFDRRADVAIAMPREMVFFRSIETDSAGLKQIRGGDLSALEHSFPIEPGELVAQVYSYRRSNEKYSVLTAAVSRAALRERLSTLTRAKTAPRLVDSTIFAVHSAVAVNHPEIKTGTAVIAYMDESYLTLAVTRNNSVVIVRNIPVCPGSDKNTDLAGQQVAELLAREVRATWQKVFGVEIEQGARIYLVGDEGLCRRLAAVVEENLPCRTIIVEPFKEVKSPPEYRADATISVAEGLALRLLAPEETAGVNFLDAAGAGAKVDLKKEAVIFATLIAAIIAVWLVGLFVRLSFLETRYSGLKSEINQIFKDTLPEEKNIINPLVQLEQKLQSMRTDYRLFGPACGSGPLEVLHAISTSIGPERHIDIEHMLITGESVRLTGTSQSFESVYDWQRRLEAAAQFSQVDVQNIHTGEGGGLVRFTVLISLALVEKT